MKTAEERKSERYKDIEKERKKERNTRKKKRREKGYLFLINSFAGLSPVQQYLVGPFKAPLQSPQSPLTSLTARSQ